MLNSNQRQTQLRFADIVTVLNPLESADPTFKKVFETFFDIDTSEQSQREESKTRIRRRVGYPTGLSPRNVQVSYQAEYNIIHVMYHQTSIVEFMPDRFELNTGGWGSRSTGQQIEQWLNWALPLQCRVSYRYNRGDAQHGTLYITLDTQTYVLEDGMQFSYGGQSMTGAQPFTGRMRHEGQQIAVADSLELLTPHVGSQIGGFGTVIYIGPAGEVPSEYRVLMSQEKQYMLQTTHSLHPVVVCQFESHYGKRYTWLSAEFLQQHLELLGARVHAQDTLGFQAVADAINLFGPQLGTHIPDFGIVVYVGPAGRAPQEFEHHMLSDQRREYKAIPYKLDIILCKQRTELGHRYQWMSVRHWEKYFGSLNSTPDAISVVSDMAVLPEENWQKRMDEISEQYPEYQTPEGSEDVALVKDAPPKVPTQAEYPRLTPSQMREEHARRSQGHALWLEEQAHEADRDKKIAVELSRLVRQYANAHEWGCYENDENEDYEYVVYGKRFADGIHSVQMEGIAEDRAQDDSALIYDDTYDTMRWDKIFADKDILKELRQEGYNEYEEISPETYFSYAISGERKPEFNQHQYTGERVYQHMLRQMMYEDKTDRPFDVREFSPPAHWPVPLEKPEPDQYTMFDYKNPTPSAVSLSRPRMERDLRPHLYTGLTFDATSGLRTYSDVAGPSFGYGPFATIQEWWDADILKGVYRAQVGGGTMFFALLTSRVNSRTFPDDAPQHMTSITFDSVTHLRSSLESLWMYNQQGLLFGYPHTFAARELRDIEYISPLPERGQRQQQTTADIIEQVKTTTPSASGGLGVFFDNGKQFMGFRSKDDVDQINMYAIERGHVGYLESKPQFSRVRIYYHEKPDATEIQRLRQESMPFAEWIALPVADLVNVNPTESSVQTLRFEKTADSIDIEEPEEQIVLHDMEGIARKSGTDINGLKWIEFDDVEEPGNCVICEQELWSGWMCLDGGDEVCDSHVVFAEDVESVRALRFEKIADWEEYLSRLSFDPSTFFQYARPGQIWSYVRAGQGPRAGQDVRRFVHLSAVDDARGQVSGVFGYSWDSVMQSEGANVGYPAAARPTADEWQDIRYIASYKPYVDVNDYNSGSNNDGDQKVGGS
jgi:hypothetical protein